MVLTSPMRTRCWNRAFGWMLRWRGVRGAELRTVSISYVLGFLAVLTVAHVDRDGGVRVISFRRASRMERENYDAWLENECDEP